MEGNQRLAWPKKSKNYILKQVLTGEGDMFFFHYCSPVVLLALQAAFANIYLVISCIHLLLLVFKLLFMYLYSIYHSTLTLSIIKAFRTNILVLENEIVEVLLKVSFS